MFSVSLATLQLISIAWVWLVSRVMSSVPFSSSEGGTAFAVLSLQTAMVVVARPAACSPSRYARRTCPIRAMLGTSTTASVPSGHSSLTIRIDTRVLPVPQGSTSLVRPMFEGRYSRLAPWSRQSSASSDGGRRSTLMQSLTASSCIAVRGSGSRASASSSLACLSSTSAFFQMTSHSTSARSFPLVSSVVATSHRSLKILGLAFPANFWMSRGLTLPALLALHWMATRSPSVFSAT